MISASWGDMIMNLCPKFDRILLKNLYSHFLLARTRFRDIRMRNERHRNT